MPRPSNADLADLFTARLHRIRRLHTRDTGMVMSIPDAIDELSRQTDEEAFDPFVERRDHQAVRKLLAGLGYGPERIAEAIADLWVDGHAWKTERIDDEDRKAVEALLDHDPRWKDTKWEKLQVNHFTDVD